MDKGDYVLATKYDDGDPGDHFCVGHYDRSYDHFGQTRHLVLDSDGAQFRGNGFRRVERITDAEGRWLLERFDQFKPMWIETNMSGQDELHGKSVWDWLAECRAERTSDER